MAYAIYGAMFSRRLVYKDVGKGRDRSSSPVLLGPGEYFLMGDNRDNSLDSRAFGPVSREQILGKVIAIFQTGQRDAGRE